MALFSRKNRRIAKDVVKTGAFTVSSVILLVLKIIGTVLLILLTTGLVFACISALYLKTNFSKGVDVELEDITLKQSSIVYYTDPSTG